MINNIQKNLYTIFYKNKITINKVEELNYVEKNINFINHNMKLSNS